jgi:hypothetical protein
VLGAHKVKNTRKSTYKAMTKPQRKKWSVSTAINILNERGEIQFMDKIQTIRKKDDLADVLCQLQAYKYLVFVDKQCID